MFIRNCWYVAAWSHELAAGQMMAITIVNEPLVIYRGGDGRAVTLQDRCCHRAAPLSKGRIEGDDLRCMYHGLKFDPTGACIEIPGQDRIPSAARVPAFPTVERHSWVWVWMGDPALADPALIPPAVGFEDDRFTLRNGAIDYQAHYELINDNLTDFSHLSFVHANSFGATETFARTRPNVAGLDRGIRVSRWIRQGFSEDGKMAHRLRPSDVETADWQTYDFLAPGVLLMLNQMHPASAVPEDGVSPPTTPPLSGSFTSQAVTPMTDRTSRYFFSWGPYRKEGSDVIADGMIKVALRAFAEDKEMIEAQQRTMDLKPGPEILTNADVGPVQMRAVIRRLIKAETDAPVKIAVSAQ